MKMTSDHYALMKKYVGDAVAKRPIHRDSMEHGWITAKRYRWDMLHYAKFPSHEGGTMSGTTFICKNLYPYLNDEHIDTALRQITETAL